MILRTLVNDDASATVSDYGAHLIAWTPRTTNASVLWQPHAMPLVEGTAMRAGVPLVFPWFNGGYEHGAMTAKKPKHGIARVSFWKADAATLNDRHIRYTLDSADLDADTLAQMISGPDSRFTATFDIDAGDMLTMALTVTNTGDVPIAYEAALHTYFRVGDATRASVIGLTGARYLDATRDGFPECVQDDDAMAFTGEVLDRIYYSESEVQLRDEAFGRTIVIGKSGSPQTVVWNPGEVGGNALADLDEGEWRDFVCVEAAANREHAVSVAPGSSHTLSQTLRVK